MDRVADAWDRPSLVPISPHHITGDRLDTRSIGRRRLEHAGHVFDRASVARPEPEQPGRDCCLQRLRSTEIGEPGGNRARGHAVLDQRDGDGVEDGRLLGSGQAALQLQEGEVAQRDCADQVDQLVAPDDDPVGGAVGDVGAQPAAPGAAHPRVTESGVL